MQAPWIIDSSLVSFEDEKEEVTFANYYSSVNLAQKLPKEALRMAEKAESVKQFTALVNQRERLRHPNISQFLGIVSDKEKQPKWVLLEKLDHSLNEWLEQNNSSLTIQGILDIAKQICLGLIFLHSQKIAHGALHLTSVLMGRGNTAKLAFILKQQFFPSSTIESRITNDIRNFGKILLQLLAKHTKEVNVHTYRTVLNANPVFSSLLSSCLAPHPKTSSDLLSIILTIEKYVEVPQLTELIGAKRRGRPVGSTTRKKQKV